MKKNVVFWVAAIALSTASCRKELAWQPAAASQKSDASTAATSGTVSAANKLSLTAAGTNYGALIDASEAADGYTFTTDVASQLGISCVRDVVPVPSSKKVKMLNSEYNILLNFTSSAKQPMAFRTDINAYQKDLKNTISTLLSLPKIAVIENEESNKKYYSGTANQYINQLKAAITVMHSYGIPVTNGGITSSGLKYLVYQDYLDRGMTAEANDYKKRMNVAVKNADTQERANFISVLLAAYATMDLDYVNFHWYSRTINDVQGLAETIDYLKRVTGKEIITNELGQYDQDSETLTSSVNVCSEYNFPYVIWYSGEYGGRSYPLNYGNGSLTHTGDAYRNLIESK